MSEKCGICKAKINSRSSTVSCGGFCGQLFHSNCCNISADVLKVIEKTTGRIWRCTTCNDLCVKFKFDEINDIFEKKLSDALADVKNMFAGIRNDITSMAHNIKLQEINGKNSNSSNNNSKPLYSTIVQKHPSIIIKPKNLNQTVLETKGDIFQEINPADEEINITSVKSVSRGGIVLGCKNAEEISKLKDLANVKLMDKYDVKEAKNLDPRIRVVGIYDKMDEGKLCSYIRFQNKNVIKESSDVKVIKFWATKKNKNVFQAILQVDAATYWSIMTRGNGKLFVGYNYCDVYDSVQITRCFKCNSFNHMKNNCSSSEAFCPRCAQQHQVNSTNTSIHMGKIALQIAQYMDGSYKICEKPIFSFSNDSINACITLLENNSYNELVDFDNHLDNISLDWTNSNLNKQIESLL